MPGDRVVFVIDDDPIILASTAALLESSGLKVKMAASAEDFLVAYDPDEIGCLLLDVRLPGMSGVELHNKLQADGIDIPTILISGHARSEISPENGTAHRDARILEKPVDAHKLIELIGETMSA